MSDPEAEMRSVVVEREMAAAPEKLWRALTQPHLLEAWLMHNDFEPVPGHRFTLRREVRGTRVVIECQVCEVEPNRTLSYSWTAFGHETVVTFTLTPTPAGTRLRLEQSGFRADQTAALKGAGASWPQFFDALEGVLQRMDTDATERRKPK